MSIELQGNLHGNNDPIQHLFDTSVEFRKVVSGALTLKDFSKTQAFTSLYQVVSSRLESVDNSSSEAQRRDLNCQHALNKLVTITPTGVVCAWILKLKFNHNMSDHDFFLHMLRADKIFSGQFTALNFHDTNHANNDVVSIMWGLQGLASIHDYTHGAIRVRLTKEVCNQLYLAFQHHTKVRWSTHAQFTRIDKKGLGKDIVRRSHRLYTPLGYGTLLIHRTYKTDEDARMYHSRVKKDIETFDLFFKLEAVGLSDKWTHSVLHCLGPVGKALLYLGLAKNFYSKSTLMRKAEHEFGVRKKITHKEHVSHLGKKITHSFLDIIYSIEADR